VPPTGIAENHPFNPAADMPEFRFVAGEYPTPSDLVLALQDFDRIEPSNDSTSVLSTLDTEGISENFLTPRGPTMGSGSSTRPVMSPPGSRNGASSRASSSNTSRRRPDVTTLTSSESFGWCWSDLRERKLQRTNSRNSFGV